MINKISFTGRETLLTNAIKPTSNNNEFLSYAKVYTKEEIAKMKEQLKEVKAPESKNYEYISPYTPTMKKEAASVDFMPETLPHNLDTIA